ncbi:MAG: hypothetical protein P8J29_07225 [Rhodospirillales bacterium]|nr:hypothetical protein [Rhodospirillales bacterium]
MDDKIENDKQAIQQVSWTDNEDDRWNQQSPASSSSGASSPTADIGSSNSASVAASSKMLAATVVSAFTDKLKAETRKNGGFLSESHVDQLSQEFEA